MLARYELDEPLSQRGFEKRVAARATIALPILITLHASRHSALLRNLSSSGAMIETLAPLTVSTRIQLHCGTMEVDGIVLWQSGADYGIKFRQPVSDQHLEDQLSRSDAVLHRRERTDLARLLKPPPTWNMSGRPILVESGHEG